MPFHCNPPRRLERAHEGPLRRHLPQDGGPRDWHMHGIRIRRYERRYYECGQHDSALASLSMAFSGGERRGLYPAPPPALPKRIWIGTCTPSLCCKTAFLRLKKETAA